MTGTRESYLDKAKQCICGKRQEDYGTPENNFAVIGQYWSTYLKREITARDVANMMTLFKIGRITSGKGTEDSYVDLIGYAACAGEIFSAERGKNLFNGEKETKT